MVMGGGEDCRLVIVYIFLLLSQLLIVLSFTQASKRRITYTLTLSVGTLYVHYLLPHTQTQRFAQKAGGKAHQYTSPVVCLSHSLPHHHFVYDYTFKSHPY